MLNPAEFPEDERVNILTKLSLCLIQRVFLLFKRGMREKGRTWLGFQKKFKWKRMIKMKKLSGVWLVILILLVSGCGSSKETTTLDPAHLTIGVTPGPHEEVMEQVKKKAAEDGMVIELQVFTEYVMPNIALAEGELDLNMFQHKPYLEKFREERNLDLVDVGYTINFPIGVYAESLESIEEIQEGDGIAIPNDPTNGARSLILLESAGLIRLEEGVGVEATVNHIAENPLNLEFIELEASQLPRQLGEVTAAVINSNFAIEYGFVPTEDSILMEASDSPYVNVVAARAENQEDPAIQQLMEYYYQEDIKAFIEERFQGSIVPGW